MDWMRYTLQCSLLFGLPLATTPFSTVSLSKNQQRPKALRVRAPTPVTDNPCLLAHQRPDDDCDGEDANFDNDDDATGSFCLYVHIPYCRRRCNYCDFAIVPIGSSKEIREEEGDDDNDDADARRRRGFETMDANYKTAILNEIRAIGKFRGKKEKIPLKSIYFGGGTPSLAPLSTLREIIHALHKSGESPFSIMEDEGEDCEITIEMDPGTFDIHFLRDIKEMGFNRISLGVQSFDDALLSNMGRVHRVKDVYRSIDMIRDVFGDDANYSIDLISGVPGLTLAKWTETLHEATRLRPRPNHMSLYDLQVEQGTAFGKWYGDAEDDDDRDGILSSGVLRRTKEGAAASTHPALPSAEDCAFMYSYASGYLRSRNYEHYEISSYAYGQNQRRSKHNQNYWAYDGQWYAVGLGSTSNISGVRYARPRALSDYVTWAEGLGEIDHSIVEEDDSSSIVPTQCTEESRIKPPWLWKDPNDTNEDVEEDEKDDALLDVVMTRLRTSEGLDMDWVADHPRYGTSHAETILRGFDLALDLDLGVRYHANSEERYGSIRLKDSQGFLFSNNIISNVFVELSEMDS